MLKRYTAILILTTILCLFCGCANKELRTYSGDISGTFENEYMIYGADKKRSVSVHEEGVFFISNANQLCYYDYGSDSSFVICSNPNCTHGNESCIAYIEDLATGYAMYGDSIYFFRRSSGSLSWEFVQLDIQNQYVEVLAKFESKGDQLNEWIITNIMEAYYFHGKAWVELALSYYTADGSVHSNGEQLIMIDLITGQVTEITEVLSNNPELSYAYFNESQVGYSIKTWYLPLMTMDEYTDFLGKNAITQNEYMEYINNYYTQENLYVTNYLINCETMEQSIFSDGMVTETIALPYWEQRGDFIVNIQDNNQSEVYAKINLSTQETYPIWKIDNGGIIGWYTGSAGIELYNNDSVLYLEYQNSKGTGKCNIYKYSIENGESTFLFEDEWYVSFRIVGQTSDKLVGKINESSQYVWIFKEDYEAGNFDTLHKFNPN